MSLLTVEKVTHGFGARQILEDASFRLLKGEHIGLIGANGEGKSTFLNIITGKILRKDRSGAADAAPLLNRYHFCTFFIDTENAEREWADSKIRQCPGPAWPRRLDSTVHL